MGARTEGKKREMETFFPKASDMESIARSQER